MTPKQKQLIRESWAKVLPIQETAAAMFYGRLFEVYPEVKPYFKGDMQEQGRKLMAMLNVAINGLDNFDALIEPLKRSGSAHLAYGVQAADYAKVADALLWTLEQGLGDAFSPDVREAWTVAYGTIANVMLEGAAETETV